MESTEGSTVAHRGWATLVSCRTDEGTSGRDRTLCSLLRRGIDGLRREQHDESAGDDGSTNDRLASVLVIVECADDRRSPDDNGSCTRDHGSRFSNRRRHQRLWELHEP